MLNTMSWDQFLGWFEFYQEDPWGEARADLRNGIACQLLANINRDPDKGKAFEASDFMPYLEKVREPVTTKSAWDAIKEQARTFAGPSRPGSNVWDGDIGSVEWELEDE